MESKKMKDPGYVDVFNSIAEVYDKRYGKGCKYAQDLIITHASELKLMPKVILDIGCGTGSLLHTASKMWPESQLIGIDPAINMIRKARERIPTANLSNHRAESMHLENASVDLVVSTTSFAHWSNQLAGLLEISRILSANGHCIIVEHSQPNLIIKYLFLLINRLANFPELNKVKKLIESTELNILKLEKIGPYLLIHLKK